MHHPMMVTDIILENEQEDRRIIIDTKFTNILTRSQFGDGQRFKTGHIYQFYSYVRSQERDDDPRSLNCEGVLLYPAVGFDVDEVAEVQEHLVRFATIDLAAPTSTVVEKLRQLPIGTRLVQRSGNPGARNYDLQGWIPLYWDSAPPLANLVGKGFRPCRGLSLVRICCNYQKTAGERWVGSTGRRLMKPPRTAC